MCGVCGVWPPERRPFLPGVWASRPSNRLETKALSQRWASGPVSPPSITCLEKEEWHLWSTRFLITKARCYSDQGWAALSACGGIMTPGRAPEVGRPWCRTFSARHPCPRVGAHTGDTCPRPLGALLLRRSKRSGANACGGHQPKEQTPPGARLGGQPAGRPCPCHGDSPESQGGC